VCVGAVAGVDENVVWALVIAMYPAGGLVGGLVGGRLADRAGPRTILSLNNIVVVLGSVLMAAAPHVAVLITGRFVIGVACGIFTAAVPMYLGELAPLAIKGQIGSLNQATNCVGMHYACVRVRPLGCTSVSIYVCAREG
jgi:MFS family permease